MLDLSFFNRLHQVTPPPSPLDRMGKVLALQNAAIQGQGLQAQVQERQASARKSDAAEKKQTRLAEILSQATIDPATGSPDPKSPQMQQLFREFPDVHAALSEHYAKIGSEAATAENQRRDAAVKEGTLAETKATNAFNQAKERDAQARKDAEEAAGILIPGTEFTSPDTAGKPARAAQFRVRQPDGSYKNEMRLLGPEIAAPQNPPQPQPAMSPGRFQQELDLKNVGQDGAVELTPQGLDAAAVAFAKSGNLPPMGMGKAGVAVRSKIINRAAELVPNLDTVANKADLKANSDSLTQATKLKDALTSFENTALKNMTILESNAKKIVDSGSPFLNTPLRSIDEKVLGNTDLPVYRAARQIVVNEVAKLTNNPNLSGQLSDSARHEIESLMPPDMTLKQLLGLLPTLKQDMKNRTSSIDEQIAAIRGRIGGGGIPATTVTAPDGTKRTRIKF